MRSERFEEYVFEAVQGLPRQFLDRLENVEIVVEDFPDFWTRRHARVTSPYQLLGFYHGVPLTERTSGYNLIAPDKISIYRKSIEAQCTTEEEVRELAHTVVRHEVAHYFGVSDDRLRELGAY
jgi:predicted Zn-dependent protease with MMP-like domain